jgi:YidC/Oxa1 family membrane protein insertase
MQELQPKLRELQKQSGKDKEKQMQEQMRLYREHGVNPALGCLPMVIQLPVWFALYQALANLPGTYPDFAQPFLWISNLADPEAQLTFPGWPPVTGWPILTLFTGVSQWLLQKMMTPHSDDPQQQMMGQMMQLMPLMFVFFAFQVPAGLVLYWATSNIFSLVQQYFVTGWGSLVPASRSAASATNRHTAGTTTSPRDAGPAIAAAAADPGDGREPDSEPSEALTRGRRRKGKRKK